MEGCGSSRFGKELGKVAAIRIIFGVGTRRVPGKSVIHLGIPTGTVARVYSRERQIYAAEGMASAITIRDHKGGQEELKGD